MTNQHTDRDGFRFEAITRRATAPIHHAKPCRKTPYVTTPRHPPL